uniref:Uncharacterized protein n=1 Tax=Pavo cristatus TaxID=9049 RepID=A0A8C9G0L1_PAVCR
NISLGSLDAGAGSANKLDSAFLTVYFGWLVVFIVGRPVLRVPGHKPTDWEKKCLLWAGHFKKPEDIPEVVSIDAIRAAQTTLRVKFSYVMIALTIAGCIVMVIRGKQVSVNFWLASTNAS